MYNPNTGRAWLEVDLENLSHNAAVLQEAMPPKCQLMAVVKAEAYGHGGAVIASHLNKLGVSAFAVATIDEGIALRKRGIRGDILILGYTDPERANELLDYDLTQTLIDFAYAQKLSGMGLSVKAHLKIDTGMRRLGIPCENLADIKEVFRMKHIRLWGMFTHLCCAESLTAEDTAFTRGQISGFYRVVNSLKKEGLPIPKLHLQSSYGLLNYPELQCDYIRTGIALYGVLSAPGEETNLKLDLRPVLSLKSRVVLLRDLKSGESLGYDRRFTAARNSRIAILPIGYADGFPRALSQGKGSVLLNGRLAPIAGNICMDQLAVDITEIPGVKIGTVATLISAEKDSLSAPQVAFHAGTISNELLSRLGSRLPIVIA